MATIKPFKSIRPAKKYQNIIPSLPYDVFNRTEAANFVSKHPHSFLAIDRPETQFDSSFDMYSQTCYNKANSLLNAWIDEGSLIKDSKDNFYLYELIMNGRSQTGLVACASVDDYLDGTIKKHENTRSDKELDRINHVYTCKAQTGPIFLACKHNQNLSNIFNEIKKTMPEYDFEFDDGVRHKVWLISESKKIIDIENIFNEIGSIYIADGHHRCASAVKVAQRMRQENPEYNGNEEFNYFLSVIFPSDELKIYDYNRVVKDLNGLSVDEFIQKISQFFDIEKIQKEKFYPPCKNKISMYLDDNWYLLRMKDSVISNHPVDGLDVEILQKNVFDGILGIKDPKTNNRIDFVGGIRGLDELEKRASNDCVAAFAMYPTSIDELMDVADAGLLMPPKSTWFEPKLRSGIFIHKI